MSGPVIGVDLGGTNMQLGVVDADGTIIAQRKKKTKAFKGVDALFDRLVGAIEAVCDDADIELSSVEGVGVAVAAAVDRDRGMVLEAPNLGWEDFPLARELFEKLGVPVAIENDVNGAVLGELHFGAIKGEREALGVWVGTGIGGAIVLDGDLHLGAMRTAGEVGHMTLYPRPADGRWKLEDTCSRSAVVRRLTELAPSRETMLHELSGGDVSSIRSSILAKAYGAGDALTQDVIHDAADLLGCAVGSAVTLMSVPVVLMGGGLTEAIGAPFVDRVAARMREHIFPASNRGVRVVATTLNERAGILGGAMTIRRELGA